MSNSAFSKGGQTNFNNTSVTITGESTKTITIVQANGNSINTTFSVGDPLPAGILGDVLYIDGTGDWVASNLCTLVNACIGDLYTRVDNLENTVSTEVNTSIPPVNYGYLYNWYGAMDSRNIANTGWHVPSGTELLTLANYLGGETIAGGKLKETGNTHWDAPNTGATNETNFNGRGAGQRSYYDGTFSGMKNINIISSSTAYNANAINSMFLQASSATSYVPAANTNKKEGISIRLIKNSTTLTNGQSGTYTGNDGKTYRTICIGTQEWLADNLAETKYRDGSLIPVVTDNSAWAALTTGARCAYNNYDPYV